jgi:hypothetical protein
VGYARKKLEIDCFNNFATDLPTPGRRVLFRIFGAQWKVPRPLSGANVSELTGPLPDLGLTTKGPYANRLEIAR